VDQRLDLQLDALKLAGVRPDNMHVEQVSGASARRPSLDLAIKDLREGDTLVVWRLDRLARSMRQLYQRLDQIYAKGAGFRSLTENFDFGTVSGKFILGILGLVAEFERQIIAQRTAAGIAALKARKGNGYKWGRELYMTSDRIKLVGDHLNGRNGKKKLSGPKIAKKLGVSTASVYGYWKQTGKGTFVRRRPEA
jgi:DNA invertase Pin-like site-specific DNA recombinase